MRFAGDVRVAVIRLLLLGGCVACTPPSSAIRVLDAAPQEAGASQDLGADVVARVGQRDILVAELSARARLDAVDPRQALDSLEREELLLAEAQRRGYGQRPEVLETVRRASTRRLLSELEAAVPPERIDDAAVRARFEATRGRFDQPERRDVVHIVWPLPPVAAAARDEAAHVRMNEVAQQLGSTPEPEREHLLEEYEHDPHLNVEPVPGVSSTTPFDQAFLHSIFSLDAPGVVPEPVRAFDGWHVVWVQEIHAAMTPDFELQRGQVARELLAQARARRLSDLVHRLRDRAHVNIDEVRVREQLGSIPATP